MSAVIFLGLRLALVICLYAFLSLALFTLWQSVRQQGKVLAARKTPPLKLVIQTPGQPSISMYFTQDELTIGRDKACDVSIADEMVSAQHARLSFHHGQWWLQDLNSTNGTYLNAERMMAPTVITSGDEIRCGSSLIALQISESDRQRL
jgi:pSer/pThr/pTyr-binding forkhead associated (FHA) protein